MFTLPYQIVAFVCAVMFLCATLQVYLIHLRGITLGGPLGTYVLMGVLLVAALLYVGRACAPSSAPIATLLDLVTMVSLATSNVVLCLTIFRTRHRPGH
jgi:DMSO reductase anchor subunit